MNCKYCGAALPTKGGVCPGCGKMIPMDQQRQMHEMLDPRWNEYRNKNTALYKKEKAYNPDERLGKMIVLIIVVVVILIIVALSRG